METVFQLPSSTFIGGREKALPLKDIVGRLEQAYCRSAGRHSGLGRSLMAGFICCGSCAKWMKGSLITLHGLDFTQVVGVVILHNDVCM